MPRFAWAAVLISAIGVAGCQTADQDTAERSAAVGDAETGQQAAMDWCGGCHAIGAGDIPEGDAPSFMTLLELRSPESIRHYLTWERHPAMPAMALESQDIEDLVAYFTHLQGR